MKTDNQNKGKIPKPISILILTLLTTLLWVSLSVYRTFTIKPPTIVPTNITKPIDPNINLESIQLIESAIFIPDSEIPPLNIESNTMVVPIPTITPEPINVEATQSASPSAQI